MEKFFVQLTRDSSIQLSCSFIQSSRSTIQTTLIVFLNGISTPQKLWYPVAELLRYDDTVTCPPMLMYDRVGQPPSIGHNQDVPGRPQGHGRDCLDASHDLREVITWVGEKYLGICPKNVDTLRIIFVASSVACAIARLYAAEYPKNVVAFLFVDSSLANSDTVSLFPDPNSPGFSVGDLPAGVTPELCLETRKKIFPIYASQSKNLEGLWRGTLPSLLPYSDSPRLQGPVPGTPYVTVIGHDPEVFPLQVQQALGLAQIMTRAYFDPAWHCYNEGLAKLTTPNLSKGPIIAKGCGHLIQKDNPQFVANEVLEVVKKLDNTTLSHL
ncbi:hypothetical protein OIDMADRAFT_171633 [Oidiodendron maius Zn]|uniref:AB hydrolase-1 domain-containing protein n=1 Tax=Oidiodendron maius (strain Zn) TaxID=913774 RepID=A0A0C3C7D1_OIDMZ|nr:hypothetical protein OIDMADRAFT_171633 [Oidiodendron maius Zn]